MKNYVHIFEQTFMKSVFTENLKNFSKNINSLKSVIFLAFFIISFSSYGGSLTNQSWSATSNLPGATNVTYTFTYTIATANPYLILYASNQSGWDLNSVGTLSASNLDVKINGTSVAVNYGGSFVLSGSNFGVQLTNSALATAGANIVVTLNNVTNGSVGGSYGWYLIRTANGSGNVIDDATFLPINLVALAPSAPVASIETNVTANSFTANWAASSGATTYYLDVATDNAFSNLVAGYSNKNVGNVTSSSVTGLSAATNYYYRVRASNGSVSGNSSTISLTTLLNAQTITYGAIASKVYGTADFSPGATASSSLAVTYTSTNTLVATIVSNQVHIVGVGTSTINANQAGNASYSAAPQVGQLLTVTAKALTVSSAVAANKVYNGLNAATISGATLTGVVGADVVTLATATTGTFGSVAVGNAIAVTPVMTTTGAAAGNYTLTQPTLSANITARSIEITATSGLSKIVGASDPTLTYSITTGSLVSGDNLTGTLSRTAGEIAGDYPILIGSLTAGNNYSITFVSADFSINVATSIANSKGNAVSIYPNPTSDVFKLSGVQGVALVTVTDLSGRKVICQELNSLGSVSVKNLPQGTYCVSVSSDKGVFVQKLIKK